MSRSVRVDKDSCLSSGRCVQEQPDAFRFDADFLAEPTAQAGALPVARLTELAFQCPAGAIDVTD